MHWWIIIIIIGFNVLMLLADMRFVYHYMHLDDYKYNQGILAQVMAVIGCQLVWMLFCIMPTDVYNTIYGGGFDMLYFWQLVYLFLIVYLTALLPFSVFYYEAESDPRLTKTPAWRKALFSTGITVVVSWGIVGLLYLSSHRIEIPIASVVCIEVDPINSTKCLSWGSTSEVWSGSLAFLTFLVALPSVFGWILFSFQGGVGLASTPLFLIYNFISRPQPINLQQYERLKKLIGERATAMRGFGETLMKKERTVAAKGTLSKTAQRVKLRQRISKYKQVVLLLEREFEMLETAYKQRGANPIYAWFSLSLGVLSAILTIAWIMQIIIAVLFPAITGGNAVFLDGLLKIMSKAHVLGPDLLVYSLLCGYLVIVSLHGNIRINFRSCLPMQPLKKQDTHLNALLFHIALCLLSTTSIVQLSYEAFHLWAERTEAEVLFTLQRRYIRLSSTLYRNNVFVWVMVVVFILALIWLIIYPEEQPAYNISDPKTMAKWEKLQKELGMDQSTDFDEIKQAQAEFYGDDQADQPPETMAGKALSRLQRIDKGIERAPRELLGMGMGGAPNLT